MRAIIFVTFTLAYFSSIGQPVPAVEENIPYLVTFGKSSDNSWGDDDFRQVFYFQVPEDYTDPIYLRVYDPDCSGENDEPKSGYNTKTRFSVYGGEGVIGEKMEDTKMRKENPEFDYKRGELLATKVFGEAIEYDEKWYTFGPFNPSEGMKSTKYGGVILKLVCEGIAGDDGNLYKYFMSNNSDSNVKIEGGNAFTFEYTFRLHSDPNQISNIFPYIDDDVISVRQSNFDWDGDGVINLISNVTQGYKMQSSLDNRWVVSTYQVKEAEKGKSLKIQFIKDKESVVRNNNVVFNIVNQYGEMMPNYTVPIGGVPKYQAKATFQPIK